MKNSIWLKEDLELIPKAKDFSELREIGMRVLERLPKPVHQVCGPISTGGFNNRDTNIKVFSACVERLRNEGITVFDWMPLQDRIGVLLDTWLKENDDAYCKPILDDLFYGFFNSGHVSVGHFLPTWQTSTGTKWERETLTKLGIEIREFPQEWFDEIAEKIAPGKIFM